MGLKSRNKGKRGEREAVAFLKSIGFEDARRTQQYNGDGDSDVVCPESLPHVHIEVKYGYDRAKFDVGTQGLADAFQQAKSDLHDGGMVPVVLWRPKGCRVWRLSWESLDMHATVAGPDDIRECLCGLESGEIL